MLKIYFLCCLLLLCFFIQAQIIDPSIVNSAGGKIKMPSFTTQGKNNWILDWSLGEPFAIQMGSSKNKIIFSIGFLQPNLLVSPRSLKPGIIDFRLVWGPNPVNNYMQLSCKEAGIDIISIHVLDGYGHSIQNIQGPFSGLHFSKQISFASVNTGIYFISIHYIAQAMKQVKIIKVLKI